MGCTLEFEEALRKQGFSVVAGVDEAGRGPLAGPVVVCAVVLPEGFSHPRLNDSKQLSALARADYYAELTSDPAIAYCAVVMPVGEVDRMNILRATHEGMRRAVRGLRVQANHVLIDGLPVQPFDWPQTALVKGDSRSLSIAAASIIAKVTRDRIMDELDGLYPAYGFAKHKGYGTAEHLAKIREHGPCPEHRRSFAPVAQPTFDFF